MVAEIADAVAVSCSLEADALESRSTSLRAGLFTGVEETRELPDGFAYRFPGGDEWKAQLFDFVNVELTCCAFFRIEISFDAGLGPIWLRLTGPSGTKEFIREIFGADALVAASS